MKFHIFHKWTKWKEVRDEEGKLAKVSIYEPNSNDKPINVYYQQKRQCLECGKVQYYKAKLF